MASKTETKRFVLTADATFDADDLLDAFRKLSEHFACLADGMEDIRECESNLFTSGGIELKRANG